MSTKKSGSRAKISFRKFTMEDVPLYYEWAEKPYIKNMWFQPGYEPKEAIIDKIKGSKLGVPFAILADNIPIGHIQYWSATIDPSDIFPNEPKGTYGIDLFIGEESYLDKGYGTEIMQLFVDFLFDKIQAKKLIIDPDIDNKRAIHCYEKVGFKYARTVNDGVEDCYIMEQYKTEG